MNHLPISNVFFSLVGDEHIVKVITNKRGSTKRKVGLSHCAFICDVG